MADKRHLVGDTATAGSLGRLGVPDARFGHPHGPAVVVDAVPEAATGGDLELPLLELLAVHHPGAERPLQRMLAAVALTWIRGDPLPGRSDAGRGGGTELLPSLGGVVGCEAEVPAIGRRRWRNTFSALGHDALGRRRCDTLAGGGDRPPEAPGESRVGVDLRRRPPLSKQLGDGSEVVDRRGGNERATQLVDERGLFASWEERRPGKDIVERVGEPARVVGQQVAEQAGDGVEGLRTGVVACCVAQAQWRRIAPAEDDVVFLELSHYIVGLAQELGERTLDHSHGDEYI